MKPQLHGLNADQRRTAIELAREWNELSATVAANQVEQESMAQAIIDLEDALATLETGAWQSWTPNLTQSGSVAATNFRSRYAQFGKLVVFSTSLNVTASGTAGQQIRVSLPVTAATSGMPIGSAVFFDASGTAFYPALTFLASTSAVSMFHATTSGSAQILGQAVFTAAIASGDTINISGMYEAA